MEPPHLLKWASEDFREWPGGFRDKDLELIFQ